MLKLLLLLWAFTAGCLADKNKESADETVSSSTGRPRLRFFSGAGVPARGNFGSFRAQGFNSPLSLRPIPVVRKATEATPTTTEPVTTTTEPVTTTTTPEPSHKPAAEARLRPEEELSASIQGQVLQSLYTAGREPERIPRPLQKQQADLPSGVSKPVAELPSQEKRIRQPPSLAKPGGGGARRIRLLSPASLRPNILDRRQPLAEEKEEFESDVEARQEEELSPKTSTQATESELDGSNKAKEVKRIDFAKIARERYAVTKPRLRSTTAATTTTTTLTTTTTTRAPTTTTRAPTTTTRASTTTESATTSEPVRISAHHGPSRSFFHHAPTGAVRVIPIPSSPLHIPPKNMVDIDGVQVPKFSKMVKNMGLKLLHRDETSRPVTELVNKVLQEEAVAQPAVQGFRVKGDSTNRIIFLNLAELGLEAGTFKLGDSELVPVRGLTSFSDTVETGRGGVLGSVMNKDALNKMLATHLQHSQDIHERVELPNALALPQRHRGNPRPTLVNSLRPGRPQLSGGRNQRLPVFHGANDVELAPLTSRVSQQKVRPSSPIRKQPVQFFDKFDGQQAAVLEYQRPAAVAEAPPPTRTQPRAPASQSRSPSSQAFSSFPARTGSNLPSSSPLPKVDGREGELARAPKQLTANFDNFLDSVYEQTDRIEQARLEQARLSQSPRLNTPVQQQANTFQQQQPLLQNVQVPGLETVRAQEAALLALQQQQADSLRAAQPLQQQQQADSLRVAQPLHQQQRTPQPLQQQALPTYTLPVPTLTQSKVRVPGLDAVLAQQAALRAVQEQHAAQNIQAEAQNRFEAPQQVHQRANQPLQQANQPLHQANQHHSRANQQPAIPGLAQHARYVAELRVAQDALNSFN